jgi:hypothetical protein
MQAMLETLNHMQPHQQQVPPPPPPHQSRLAEFLRTCPTTFSQAKDPMDAEDWLKGVEKKLVIAQCTDREKVLFAAHELYGTATNWWETYCNTHTNVDTITWNEFKAHFRTHYVPRGTMKLKRKEFADLKQGGMTVNEYLNSFIQLSRYAPDDINTDEKKQDVFLNGLNDDIQFLLLNTDYATSSTWSTRPLSLKTRSEKWRRMARGKCHSFDNPQGVMLSLASRSLTSFSSHSR